MAPKHENKNEKPKQSTSRDLSTFHVNVGDGLSIRPVNLDDAEAMLAAVNASRASLAAWLPWPDHTHTVADAAAWIQSALADMAQGKKQVGFIWKHGTLVGGIGFSQLTFETKPEWGLSLAMGEMGYWLSEPHGGQGIMSRCVAAFTQHGFETLGLQRIEIRAEPGNEKSWRIPQRLGFAYEGLRRGFCHWQQTDGVLRRVDHHVHAALAEDWPPHPPPEGVSCPEAISPRPKEKSPLPGLVSPGSPEPTVSDKRDAGWANKSSLETIRNRFDQDVERFSDLSTGQQAAPDSPLCMDWVMEAALAWTPLPKHVLDLGCGAGNYSLKLLEGAVAQGMNPGDMAVTLVDLSQPMLDRAKERLQAAGVGQVTCLQMDLLSLATSDVLAESSFDAVLAAAVLHHLRDETQWATVFAGVHSWLKAPGGFWIVDLIEQVNPVLQALMWRRYGEYLTGLKSTAYRDQVFAYIEQEDSPRPLVWQLNQLAAAGFAQVDVLHKNTSMAAFAGLKV